MGSPRHLGRPVPWLVAGTVALGSALALNAQEPVVAAPAAPAAAFKTFSAQPVLDTTTGLGAPKQRVKDGGSIDVQVAGQAGVPSTGVTAVALQVGASNPVKRSEITVFATGKEKPAVPTLSVNGQAGMTTAIVPLGDGGKVRLHNAGRAQDLSASVSGYWSGSSDLAVLPANAVLDTRAGLNAPKAQAPKDKALSFTVNGVGGVPESGVSAVALQISTEPSTPAGFLTAYPTGTDRPKAPSLVLDGGTGATTAIVGVGTDGKVDLFNGGAPRHITVAVTGYWKAKTELTSVTAQTVLDTRSGLGAPKGQLRPGQALDLKVAGMGGVPAEGATAVAVQLTGEQSHRRRTLRVYAKGSQPPTVPSLIVSERSASTTVLVPIGEDGKITVRNDGDKLHLQASFAGYWTPPAPSPAPELSAFTDCEPNLALAIGAAPSVVTEGGTVQYALNLRNDPEGACLDVAGQTVLSGVAHLPAGAPDNQLTDIAVWLEAPGRVLPASAGLTAGTLCPGDDLANCTSANQPQYGQINYPEGPALPFVSPLPIPEDTGLDVPFRFFPKLSEADRAALSAPGAELVVAATTTAGDVQISRTPVNAKSAPAAADTTVKITLPDKSEKQVSAGTLAAGSEKVLEEAADYVVRPEDEDTIVTKAIATSGKVSSPVAEVSTVVILSPDAMTPLLPTASPDIVEKSKPTEVFFAVTPTFTPSGPLTLHEPKGAALGELKDDGSKGDVIAGDGSFGASFILNLSEGGTFTVRTTGENGPLSGEVAVVVAEAGQPVAPAQSDTSTLLSLQGAGEAVANELVVTTVEKVTFAQLKTAAALVGGTVTGRVDPVTWQIKVPAMTSKADLDAALKKISEAPGIVGAGPNPISEITAVTPDDPQFGAQWHLPYTRTDEAWAFNRGGTSRVISAVIDTGLRASHEDHANAVGGRDAVKNNANPADDQGHGTHVAGILGATTFNKKGGAGVSWNGAVMPVKVNHNTKGQMTNAAILAGTRWAVDHGARVVNMSLGGPRSEDTAKAVDYAWNRNRLVVAAAGNNNCSTRSYPGGYNRTETFSSFFGLFKRTYDTELLSVGANDSAGKRSIWTAGKPTCTQDSGSNYGSWVDLSAPGTGIQASLFGSDSAFGAKNGTSMATPVAAGVASLVMSQESELGPGQVKARLMSTTRANASGADIGTGSVDAFGATFNGSFEAGGSLGLVTGPVGGPGFVVRPGAWKWSGTAYRTASLGPITPRTGSWMGYLSTGPAAAQTSATFAKTVRVQPAGLKDGRLRFTFQYNYVTEEYPEFVGTAYDDDFVASLRVPTTGQTFQITKESVNATTFSLVSGINFPGGDSSVGQSGWKTAVADIDASQLAGATTLELVVTDRGDAIYDSVVLLDNFRVQ